MKLGGMSQTAIADYLNSHDILSPMEYKHRAGNSLSMYLPESIYSRPKRDKSFTATQSTMPLFISSIISLNWGVPTLKPFKEEQVMGNIQKIRKIYHAAIYVRLSKEDGDVADAGKKESNSISNQKSLIRDFLRDKESKPGCRSPFSQFPYSLPFL